MKNEKMKLWYSIVILLVCFVACKNSSLKQREIMSPSVQDTLKEPRYDSIVYFDERPYDVSGDPRDGRKYYLHKDSLFFRGKDTFYCREYSILEGIQSVEFSMKKVQNRRKQSLLWSIGITIMEK